MHVLLNSPPPPPYFFYFFFFCSFFSGASDGRASSARGKHNTNMAKEPRGPLSGFTHTVREATQIRSDAPDWPLIGALDLSRAVRADESGNKETPTKITHAHGI